MTAGGARPAGIVVAPAGSKWYAWAGVEVTGALDARRLAGYAGLPAAQRMSQAHEADARYLARLAELPDATVDYRWLADGTGPRLAVLGACAGASAAEAAAGALALRDQLGRVPDHVAARPVADTGALLRLLHPFDPVTATGITRRPITARPNRPDAHTSQYAMVQACGWHPACWERLLETLAAHPVPVLLSVGLRPWAAPRQLAHVLEWEANCYERLARETWVAGAGLAGRTRLADERFAGEAAPRYRDALRRYAGRVFRVRVTLAAAGPLRPELVTAVLAALATPDPAGLGAFDHLGPALASVAQLLDGLGVPPPSPDSAHLLASIADPAEAAAYCPFPLADGGARPPLPVLDPPPDRLAAGVVMGDLVYGDKHGDSIISGGKHVYGGTE